MILFFSFLSFGLFFGFFDVFYFFFCFLGGFIFLLGGGYDFSFLWMFFSDGISFFLIFLSLGVFLFCYLSSFFDIWVGNYFSGFSLILGLIFFFVFLGFSCFGFFLFYVCFEFIFLLMFIFVLSWGYSPERLQASFYMVFYTLVVSFPFLVYLIVSGVLNPGGFLSFMHLSSYWWCFLFVVFFVKLPVYGVHLWLPKAHVEAPVSGSMVLAGVLLKLGGYGVYRFSFFSLSVLGVYSSYFISIGLVGGLVSCFLCLRQVDLKAFVAYSSICHMGVGLAGLAGFHTLGVSGGVLMMIGHGYCSSCLFYLLYLLYERWHSRSAFVLKGVLYLYSLVGLFWFLFVVLNLGVPPSLSFFSEVGVIVSLGCLSGFSFLFISIFLFVAGVYCIYLFVGLGHGISLFMGFYKLFDLRELLILYGHLYFLFFIVFFLGLYF